MHISVALYMLHPYMQWWKNVFIFQAREREDISSLIYENKWALNEQKEDEDEDEDEQELFSA